MLEIFLLGGVSLILAIVAIHYIRHYSRLKKRVNHLIQQMRNANDHIGELETKLRHAHMLSSDRFRKIAEYERLLHTGARNLSVRNNDISVITGRLEGVVTVVAQDAIIEDLFFPIKDFFYGKDYDRDYNAAIRDANGLIELLQDNKGNKK